MAILDGIDDETLELYIEESREHLSDIENDLLAIEDAGANIDETLVNKVFRAAHSLKGGAGFFNLTKIKELAHRCENVLDMIRSRELAPNPEIVNNLLLAFDKLREMINNIAASDQEDISEFIVSLTGLTDSYLPPEEKGSGERMVDITLPDGRKVMEVSELDLRLADKEGSFLYVINYDLINDVQRVGKTPLDIISALCDVGQILESTIDMMAVGTLDDEPSNRLPFYVLFATIVKPDMAAIIFEVEDDKVQLYDISQLPPESTEETADEAASDAIAPQTVTDKGAKTTKAKAKPKAKAKAKVKVQPTSAAAKAKASVREAAAPPPKPVTTAPPIPKPAATIPPTPKPAATAPPPTPAPEAPPPKAASPASKTPETPAAPVETSLRVNVAVLETLMNLAGELVLSRNQLLEAINQNDQRTIQVCGQRLNMVTSELQEAIMLTRMQPIGNIFSKFNRIVRDLSRALGKDVDLNITGKEVEMDKTIIEGLNDPLTHLVRNAVDHGVEGPEERSRAGKKATGTINLKAFHEAGQVVIEISDDGKGIDPQKIANTAVNKGLLTADQVKAMSDKERVALIMLPGLSSAEKVTDISGRGVGMDVVKTNLDKLGGQVDIESEMGKGSTFRVKLPLTLAIIPCLLVSVGADRYAVPQINVDELIRIRAAQVKSRIEIVGDAEVLILRGKLIPIVHLADMLGLPRTWVDEDGVRHPDQRNRLADRRSPEHPLFKEGAEADLKETKTTGTPPRKGKDRRHRSASDLNILVVTAGNFQYGLVVEELHDTVEIVVKPLGRHLKHLREYAGATIMGDGSVGLILDVAGLAELANLSSLAGSSRAEELESEAAAREQYQDVQSFLLFRNDPTEQCAVPLDLVDRVEQIAASQIERVGGRSVLQYRGESMPLFTLSDVAGVKPLPDQEELVVIVFQLAERNVGLLAVMPVDVVETRVKIDQSTLLQTGILGSSIINKMTTQIVDIYGLVETLHPEWFENRLKNRPATPEAAQTILLVEDSDFFRNQLKRYITEDGHTVITAEDGLVAWKLLQKEKGNIKLVVTDIEMPNMDGFELTQKIKEHAEYGHLPVIAVTSLAGDEDVARGKAVGVDEYQIKLDKDRLLECIRHFLNERQ